MSTNYAPICDYDEMSVLPPDVLFSMSSLLRLVKHRLQISVMPAQMLLRSKKYKMRLVVSTGINTITQTQMDKGFRSPSSNSWKFMPKMDVENESGTKKVASSVSFFICFACSMAFRDSMNIARFMKMSMPRAHRATKTFMRSIRSSRSALMSTSK